MNNNLKTYFFLLIFLIAIIVNIYLFSPLFHTLAFATIIAGTFFPLFSYLRKRFNFNKNTAALIVTVIIILTVALPAFYLISQLSREALYTYQNLQAELGQEAIKAHFVGEGYIARAVDLALETFNMNITREQVYNLAIRKIQSYTGVGLKFINTLITDTLYFAFQFILMLIAIYSFFVSGEDLKNYIFKLSPLPTEQEQKIVDRYNQMNFATLVGNGIGGVVQGVLAGLSFWAAGIPSVFLWTTIMIILAFIPLIGMSIVFIPASIYLMLKGQVAAGIAVIIWCGVIALIVENVFKPKFVGDRLRVNGTLLLFYTIAGMSIFGAAGIFYGPILCILFLTIGEIFIISYLPKED